MAPKFKKLLYITQSEQHGATAFIGFPVEQLEYEPAFRESLSEEITTKTGYKHKKTTGVYEEMDVNLDFFESKDSVIIDTFYSKPSPGCLAWLFRTRYYKAYNAEKENIEPFIKVKISTSHDYPGIEIDKSIFSENELAQLIEKVAQNLKLQIHKSHFQYSIGEIIMSNRVLDDD